MRCIDGALPDFKVGEMDLDFVSKEKDIIG
jgi:hypothetical protein